MQKQIKKKEGEKSAAITPGSHGDQATSSGAVHCQSR